MMQGDKVDFLSGEGWIAARDRLEHLHLYQRHVTDVGLRRVGADPFEIAVPFDAAAGKSVASASSCMGAEAAGAIWMCSRRPDQVIAYHPLMRQDEPSRSTRSRIDWPRLTLPCSERATAHALGASACPTAAVTREIWSAAAKSSPAARKDQAQQLSCAIGQIWTLLSSRISPMMTPAMAPQSPGAGNARSRCIADHRAGDCPDRS